MTTTVAGRTVVARPRTETTTASPSRLQQWRARRAERSFQAQKRRHDREDHSDRYLDGLAAPFPAEVYARLWQR
jgi:hypothetical protein